MGDPEFDWLRRVSELIVQIDQATEDKDSPLTSAAAKELLARVGQLLTPSESGDAFARKYFEALQQNFDVGVVHGQVRGLL